MARWQLLPALLTVAACHAAVPSPPPEPPALPVASARAAGEPFVPSKAVRWVRDSAEYRALLLQIYRAATAHVEAEASTREAGTWAVVTDADETLLDNSLYQLERERKGLGFTRESWRAWTGRREAVPLPGAKAFLARVRELGGRVAIITNRRESECADTEAVLEAHDLAYDVILCRGDDGPADKAARFEAVVRGTTPAHLPPLDVVAVLGDNIRDFPGQSQEIRDEGEEAFADFGTRFFVFPNPIYGSWE
jgi:5'-nucleotidase (lipoprotein e(P4) family)